jgi:hypothetical protein
LLTSTTREGGRSGGQVVPTLTTGQMRIVEEGARSHALVCAGITDWGMQAATGEYGQYDGALSGSTGWSGIGPHPHDAVSPISFAGRIRTPVPLTRRAQAQAWATRSTRSRPVEISVAYARARLPSPIRARIFC